jgi:hypothetical protein
VSSPFTYRRIKSMSQNLQDRLGDSEDLQVTDVLPLQSKADISLDKDRLEASGKQVAILEDRIRVLEETCAAKEGAKEGADKASQEFRCEIAVLQTQNKVSRGKFGTHLVTNQKLSQTLQARLQSEKELQVIDSIALQIGPKNCCIRMVSTSSIGVSPSSRSKTWYCKPRHQTMLFFSRWRKTGLCAPRRSVSF